TRISESQLKARKPFPVFSDAFGKKNFLRDERHGSVSMPPSVGLRKNVCCCGKVTRRFCTVNSFEPETRSRETPPGQRNEVNCEWEMNESVFGDVLQQFSERFAESENFSQIGGGETGACAPDVRTFATNLNHADHFVTGKNRRADN